MYLRSVSPLCVYFILQEVCQNTNVCIFIRNCVARLLSIQDKKKLQQKNLLLLLINCLWAMLKSIHWFSPWARIFLILNVSELISLATFFCSLDDGKKKSADYCLPTFIVLEWKMEQILATNLLRYKSPEVGSLLKPNRTMFWVKVMLYTWNDFLKFCFLQENDRVILFDTARLILSYTSRNAD